MNSTRILIIGNGFGGVYALRGLHKIFHNNPNIHITLVGENNFFLFTPLLHEVATGGINPENIIEPIHSILGCCLDKFHLGKAKYINLIDKTVLVDGTNIPYDYFILAPGAETNYYKITGAEKYTFPLKSLEDAQKIKNRLITQIDKASHISDRDIRKQMLSFVVVGGGPTGVELSAEISELIKDTFSRYYSPEVIEDASVTIVQRAPDLLPQFGPKLRAKSLKVLLQKGVKVLLNTEVTEVGESYITYNNLFLKGEKIHTENIVWVAGIKPVSLEFDSEVAKTPDGKLIVNSYLQIEKNPEVFVLGDMASVSSGPNGTPLPALAQVAVKQADSLAQNIDRLMKGLPMQDFVYKNSGNLVSIGQWMAIGQIKDFYFSGGLAWWAWRTIYLSKLISWQKKVHVAIDWTIGIFSARDISKM